MGAGKSTFARRKVLDGAGVFLDLDAWMVRLYGADPRPADSPITWYLERRERCRSVVWDVAVDVLAAGVDVYLELGLVTADEREAWFRRAHADDLPLRVVVVDAPRDLRRERVVARNAAAGPATQVVPLPFFEHASDLWEPITEDERRTWDVVDG